MKLFKRNKSDQQQVPAEVQEYYAAEKRERTGVAWALSAITLVVTILLAAGLFYGGRWIYKQVFDDNDSQTTTQVVSEQSPEISQETDSDSRADTDFQTDQAQQPGSEESASTSQNPDWIPASDTAEEDTTAQETPVSNQNEANRESSLPSTGPADTAAIFVISSLLAAFAHNLYKTRRSSL